MSALGLNTIEGKLSIADVIERLEAISPNIELEEFDESQSKDKYYCVNWGIKKGQWFEQGVLERYIKELKALL